MLRQPLRLSTKSYGLVGIFYFLTFYIITFSPFGKELTIPKGAKGDKGETGAAGADAKPLTVTETTKDPEGNTVIHFSDGQTATVSKGDKGDVGAAGKDAAPLTVTKTDKDAAGNTVVHFSDGSQAVISKGDKGDTGAQGATGETGATGATGEKGEKGDSISITSITPQANGDTKVVFSDGKELTIPKGAKGDKGETGAAGADAKPLTVTETTKDPVKFLRFIH
ncbi:collagen-like triple helix repeat-containing protein [Staphylococcus simulans]|uniref:collagen-like triple helix repeat-containing protein n=1 Tax=Staphylococcus simulans TaxID=1286 RepID=UPI000D55CD12|nr:collagen-like protein [Staphylococcus simulans]